MAKKSPKDSPQGYPCAGCGEPTYNPRLCRDCDLEALFAAMTCSVCDRLHTRREGKLGMLAESLWGEGHRCECPEPKPPRKSDTQTPWSKEQG